MTENQKVPAKPKAPAAEAKPKAATAKKGALCPEGPPGYIGDDDQWRPN